MAGVGFVYAALGLAQRAIGLVLVPFLARWLTPSQYGQIGLLATLSGLALYVFPLGLEAVVMRGWFVSGEHRRQRVAYVSDVQTVLLVAPFVLILPAALLLGLLGVAKAVPMAAVITALLAAAVFVSATVVPYTVLRAERRLAAYSAISTAYLVMQVTLRVVLIGVLHKGIWGSLLTDLLSAVMVFIVAPRVAGVRLRIRKPGVPARNAVRSGLPLVPHVLSNWALALSDRLILLHAVSLAAIAQYSIGYQVGSLLIMCYTELNRALSPDYVEAGSRGEEGLEGLREVVSAQVATVIALGLAGILVVPELITVLLPASYGPSRAVVPMVALGSIFVGLYHIPMNHLTLVRGQTRRIWSATLTATIVNIVSNIIFVPRFGIMAAAGNTAVAYAVVLILVYRKESACTGSRLRPDWRVVGKPVVAMLSMFSGCLVALHFTSPVRGLLSSVVVGILIVGLGVQLFRRRAPLPSAAYSLEGADEMNPQFGSMLDELRESA